MKNKVRRFDVFAIFNYVSNLGTMEEPQAKGEAIWLAKLVASRKGGGGSKKQKADTPVKDDKTGKIQYWKSLSDIPQTDKEYDKAIIERLGDQYEGLVQVVSDAMANGMDYKQIRDCKHATGGRNTGWCKECSENIVENFKEQVLVA